MNDNKKTELSAPSRTRYLVRAKFIEPTIAMFFPEAETPEEAGQIVTQALKEMGSVEILEVTQSSDEELHALQTAHNPEKKETSH